MLRILMAGPIIIAVLYCMPVLGQKQIIDSPITIPDDQKLLLRKDFLTYISSEYGIIFSYNANILNDELKIEKTIESKSLKSVLTDIFFPDEINIIPLTFNKIIIQPKNIKEKQISLSGRIYDNDTGEAIYGALLRERLSNLSVLTNEKGYFIIDLPGGEAELEIRYLGYKTTILNLKLRSSRALDISLTSNNLLDTIYIDNPKSAIQLIDGGNITDVFKTKEFRSIIGEIDLINNARIMPGVQSGGEGQSGLYVRGGTPDQNLILLDGVGMYETSHIAGISSVFMEESIKEASFVRNGFPARYGGRLSGVMDIQLKEGDRYKQNRKISMGLSGAKFHLDGPLISEKTTYSITARTSWLNLYVNNLLRKFTKYDDINIAYSDFIGKITRHISPSSSLSLTIYTGSDRLRLTKDNTFNQDDYQLKVYDRNGLNWGNYLGSVKYNRLLSDKLSLKIQAGVINYNNGSRSTYKFDTTTGTTLRSDVLDVITKSNITDYNTRYDIEYYLSDKHVLRTGSNVIFQKFNPTVKQSTVILEGNADNIVDNDSLIRSKNFQFYVEDNFKLNTSLFIYGGLHYSIFQQGGHTYTSLQPRIKIIWAPIEKHLISVAYSKMAQYVHLLSNSGLGLPSDLWVPSTGIIKPEQSNQISVGYTFNIQQGFYINAGAYSRTFSNSIEYTSPIELFYFLINNQNIVPIYNTSRDWERNLQVGSTKSKGLEFLLHRTQGATKGWLSATRSKTEKLFPGLNRGESFPANHDRTWDFNCGLSQKFSESFSAGLNFVYATGNTFSLSTEEFDSALGIKLLKSGDRNNYRLPAFHQLSFNAGYTIKSKLLETTIGMNIYNIYNRLNAYFIYIYENPAPPYNRYLRKVSILPFTPSLSVTIKF